ncbi:MAG: S24/S26 family peptidase [Candidatus Kaelpia imicola]|nr:S24/S26 family peptidase [Candidatus Kaelpia imicola]
MDLKIQMNRDFAVEKKDMFVLGTVGFSMWPFLKSGEKVVVKKTESSNLHIGDIIVYRSNKQITCHRLVKKIISQNRYFLYPRGDNQIKLNSPILEEQLIGKAVGILRNGRISRLDRIWSKYLNWAIVKFAPIAKIILRPFKKVFFRKISF